MPSYLIRPHQDFFLQAVQYAFDCGHAFAELMNLEKRREREREGVENRPATAARAGRKQRNQQKKASSKTLPPRAELKDVKKLCFENTALDTLKSSRTCTASPQIWKTQSDAEYPAHRNSHQSSVGSFDAANIKPHSLASLCPLSRKKHQAVTKPGILPSFTRCLNFKSTGVLSSY